MKYKMQMEQAKS